MLGHTSGREKDVFGLVVRTIGLLLILQGCDYLAIFLFNGANFHPQANQQSWRDYYVFGLLFVTTGLVLIRGAKTIEKFAYPAE